MQIDAHQHFWRYDPERYDWIGPGMEVLAQDFLPAHLQPELDSVGVSGTVAVQARQDLDETRWLLELAAEHEAIRGVVGWVDLASDGVQGQLDELSTSPYLKGVRHVLQDEPDDDHMLREDFRRGLGQLEARGLSYDILIFPRHLDNALRLVDEFPEQRFVLDHLAKPFVKDRRVDPWRSQLSRLAERDNVWCKASGLVTEADWKGWAQADFEPYLDAALAAFGPTRLMFGSDWPVCTLAAGYGEVHAIVSRWARPLGEDEREALFGGNARRFYGLD